MTKAVPTLVAIWLVAVVGGSALLWRYKSTEGERGGVPAQWPSASALSPNAEKKTLLMLVHPKCNCTEASVTELARLMSTIGDRVAAHVLVVKPDATPDGWERESIFERARGIPGVAVTIDPGGVEAKRFGVATSGHTLLYDRAGRLLFSGGITSARGHEGDNAGEQRVIALAKGQGADRADSPVFGCALAEQHDTTAHHHHPEGTP